MCSTARVTVFVRIPGSAEDWPAEPLRAHAEERHIVAAAGTIAAVVVEVERSLAEFEPGGAVVKLVELAAAAEDTAVVRLEKSETVSKAYF